MTERQYICVLLIRNGHQLCCTSNEYSAAVLLAPGTTYGKGWTPTGAMRAAEEMRQFHLENGYK